MSIQVKNLEHIYNPGLPHESKALDDVSFEIEDGQFVGIIGHTGSGKSTLVQHLNGLLKPTSGQIIVDDEDLTAEGISLIDVRKRVGLVFQYPEYQLFEETVAKDISFGPRNLGLNEYEILERVKEAMELVNLPYEQFAEKSPFDLSGGQKRRVAIAGVIAMKPKILILDEPTAGLLVNLPYEQFAEKSPFDLSGGQKRRVAIAGVIAMKPKILILDEPTAGLDPKAHQDVLKMIKDIHNKEGNITIFVSHNMNDVAKLSDKILVMHGGKCVLQGTPKEVFAKDEYLKEIGLDLPDVTQLLQNLQCRGVTVPKGVFDIDTAEEFIVNLIKGGNDYD